MKLKKLPGFSLGLIALAVGNAYATQLLDNYSIISYITDEESPIEIKNKRAYVLMRRRRSKAMPTNNRILKLVLVGAAGIEPATNRL